MLKIKILSLFFFVFCLLPMAISAQEITAKSVAPLDTSLTSTAYNQAVNRLASDPTLRFGQVGVIVMDVATGQTLASQNATMSLIPASNMKIVSTAAGLGILGADYQFKTELQYDGNIRDSILYGNVFIKGSGDPTLASPLMESVPTMNTVLDSFTNEIRRLGIKKIVGKIVGDGTAFEEATATPTWLWEDVGNGYGAGPSGLNFHENLYDLTFQQNPNAGLPPSVLSINPYIPDFQLVNEIKSVPNGSDESSIYTVPYNSIGYVRGTIPTGTGKFTINGAIPDPPFFAAWYLRKNLIERGIEVTDSATTQLALQQLDALPLYRKTFFTWFSPKLSEIVRKANTESVNLYCEAILRAVALKQSGIGTNVEGIKSVARFWQTKGD